MEPAAAPPREREPEAPPAPAPPVECAVPANWEGMDSVAFERLVHAISAAGGSRWNAAARMELSQALTRADPGSVRAAVLLAHDPGPDSMEVLLARLEARVRAGSRAREGADIIAAAALEGRVGESRRARLLELVDGKRPHPDLEVRVECARILAIDGSDEVLPFLFRVLRVQTPDQELDAPDWEPTTTLYWVKFRAAEALSARAGLPMSFQPDASFSDQAVQARILAEAYDYTPAERR